MRTEWNETDPREQLQRNATIIVSAPTGVARAHVEQKHGYHIELTHDIPGGKRGCANWFSADDPWEPGYLWCIDPQEGD